MEARFNSSYSDVDSLSRYGFLTCDDLSVRVGNKQRIQNQISQLRDVVLNIINQKSK